MNEGRAFGGKSINQFNGGLFADDDDLEKLHVPNSVFCQQMQGANEANLYAYKETLLYLCASYNYASDLGQSSGKPAIDRDPSKSLGLYTLGRIFEQSITELEILEAEADGRPSVNKLSKRKRDGVYYTPEWVVERIVDETLGPLLATLKRECGWPKAGDASLEVIDAYAARLKAIKIVDPACGSGAFLITVLRYLLETWHEVNGLRRQIVKRPISGGEDAAIVADIMRANIYGVDINPASIEIAQLALWLHTARGDKPLSALDRHVREGNSLIDSNFFLGQAALLAYDADEKERVNAFDWNKEFPEVFAEGGFDAVVSNPPYVKLQNFRTAHADMASYLRDGRPGRGFKPYVSTQTGNFDLYLPFIERGISLLKDEGRLGYIAPSLWITNEYGEGLRGLIGRGRHLEGWIDFKAYQVFEEGTTYTALQFFTKHPNKSIRVVEAPTGEIPNNPWGDPKIALPYGRQEFGERWLLLTGEERALIDRLAGRCKRLDDPACTTNIFVGIQTSADAIYHLKRTARDRYVCQPEGKPKPLPYEVEIEDAVMKPIVSGVDAKRYVEPRADTYLLFPYAVEPAGVHLIDAAVMREHYPKAWAYLRSYEKELRSRESHKMDDDTIWWGYNYPKNLDKQEIVKLIVPRLVADLGCSVDRTGSTYLDNVDVGGITVAEGVDPFFIAGILNSATANFVFKRVSKPFRGSYLSANKQFIAPLPIPPAKPDQQDDVAARARALQSAHTNRRDILAEILQRLSSVRMRSKPDTWLFPKLRSKPDLLSAAPARLDTEHKREWADQHYELELSAAQDVIEARLRPGVILSAAFLSGELSFAIDGIPVVERIYVGDVEGEFICAQWRVLAATFSITENTDGKRLANALRKLAVQDNPAVVEQVIRLAAELSAIETDISAKENEIDVLIDELYGLSQTEINMVRQAEGQNEPTGATYDGGTFVKTKETA